MPRRTSFAFACLLLVGCTSADSASTVDPTADSGLATTPTVVAPAEPAIDAQATDTAPTAPAEIPGELPFADDTDGLYDE